MYGSTHSDAGASSVDEASVSLLSPVHVPRSPPNREADREEQESWKRDAWCIFCLAFSMAAIAAILGAYIIFVSDRNEGFGGAIMQASTRGQGGASRRPLLLHGVH